MRMTVNTSIAANSQVDNLIAGKLHEFLVEDSRVVVAAAASAAGLRISVLVGGEAAIQDQEVSSANRFPQLPQDFAVEHAGFANDRIVIPGRNTTGAAITLQMSIDVLPL